VSDAARRLARSRLAIVNQIKRREHPTQGGDSGSRREPVREGAQESEPEPGGPGWFARLRRAARAWWRYHPAHLGLELVTPALASYGRKKPMQYLGLAAALGGVIVLARPWRLISVTGLIVAIAKSSQLSSVVLSALSTSDDLEDPSRMKD
jgi:hypothetical protein